MPGLALKTPPPFPQASHHTWALPRKPCRLAVGTSPPGHSVSGAPNRSRPFAPPAGWQLLGPTLLLLLCPIHAPRALSSAHSSRPSEARPGAPFGTGEFPIRQSPLHCSERGTSLVKLTTQHVCTGHPRPQKHAGCNQSEPCLKGSGPQTWKAPRAVTTRESPGSTFTEENTG